MSFEFVVKPTPEEMAASQKWIVANFGQEVSVLPFSFQYGGQSSDGLLKAWKTERVSNELDESRTQHTLTYTDSKTGLEVRCVAVEYKDFPTVEWTLYFKNTGTSDTPIVSDIQVLDIRIAPPSPPKLGGIEGGREFLLHHNVGSPCKPNDYQPLVTKLQANTSKRITAAGGRPTNSDMSYFNVESTVGDGVIIVVGWPGQWCDESNVLHIRAGQELTHFKLYPGEEVRTPLIVLP